MTRQYFTPQARAAAAAARRRHAALKALSKNKPEVFVIRVPDHPGQYLWQIRHFGGVILETSPERFGSSMAARRAGVAAMTGRTQKRSGADKDGAWRPTPPPDGTPLHGLRVLVVEDDYMQADDIKGILYDSGADTVVLAGHLDAAMDTIDRGFDVVLLDINLHGQMSYSAADKLDRLQLPFAFITGYDKRSVPERFARHMHLDKPLDPRRLADNVRRLWRAEASS